MGKTKVKTIDDSTSVKEVKKEPRKKILTINREEKPAKREKILAINKDEDEKRAKSEETSQVARGDAEESSRASTASEQSERGRTRETEAAGPRAKETPKQGQPKYRSKKYQQAQEKIEKSKIYPLNEAIELVKQTSYSKFDGSLEIHINTAAKNIHGLIQLPYFAAKKIKVCAFGKGALESGADIVGDEKTLEEIEKGKINFEVLVVTAEWMPKLARLAKILGPRNLMPNPKNGTITQDLKKAVSEIQSGKAEYKTEKSANLIHLKLGQLSQPTDELGQNIKLLLTTIGKSKLRKATLSPTMGPGVKIDLTSI